MNRIISENMSEIPDWSKNFSSKISNLFGVVKSISEANDLISQYETDTTNRFTTARETKDFNRIDENVELSGHAIHWELRKCADDSNIPFDGMPFVVVGTQVRCCHHGPDRHVKTKAKYKANQNIPQDDHNYVPEKKGRHLIQSTKKMDCPATIRLRAVIKFPEYKIQGGDSKWKRKHCSKLLRKELEKGGGKREVNIFLKLPDPCHDHRNHITGEFAGLSLPVDERIISKIHSFVNEGVRSVQEMKRHLRLFVLSNIPSGHTIPETNRRFYPTNKDVRNHMYRALRFCQFSPEDQENLGHLVKEWQSRNPDDFFFYQPNKTEGDCNITEDEVSSQSSFLFVHQTKWQRKLLQKYGNEICLLDATYKTSKYDLPLFFLCVNTNVGYSIVASFIVPNENKEYIQAGLLKIKEWNQEWGPKNFMTDFDEREIWAIENTFEGCHTFLCDFHREQAWCRWLKDGKHGLSEFQTDVLALLRGIACSRTEDDYLRHVEELKTSFFWISNSFFRRWFQSKWLDNAKRWVQAFRNTLVNARVTTTNGLERQHHEFKKRYLACYSEGSLSSMLTTLITRFLPDAYKRYIEYNVQAMDEYRKYSPDLPSFLKNRPKLFLNHCLKRIPPSATFIPLKQIYLMENGDFEVRSTDSNMVYLISLNSSIPHCSCADWNKYHLPCKHMLSVFHHYPAHDWDFLHPDYRDCPHFSLDQDFIYPVEQSTLNCLMPSSPSAEDTDSIILPSPKTLENREKELSSENEQSLKKVDNSTKHFRLHCLQTLKEISSNLYLIPNEAEGSLQKVYEDLQQVARTLRSKIPTEDGLPLRTTALQVKRKYREKYKSLPSRKRKQKELAKRHRKNKKFPVRQNPSQDVIVPSSKTHSGEEKSKSLEGIIDILWKCRTPVGHLLSKLGHFNITDFSIENLKSTLPDEVLDAYLFLTANSQEVKRVLYVNCTVMSAVFRGEQQIHSYLQQVTNLYEFDVILGAPNEGGHHWSLVFILPKERKVIYVDPLGETVTRTKRIAQRWRNFMSGRRELGLENSAEDWAIETVNHSRQRDSSSCGVLVIKFAELLLAGKSLEFDVSEESVLNARKEIGNILIKNTDDLDQYCRACYGRASEAKGILVQCESCTDEKLFHMACPCKLHPIPRDLREVESVEVDIMAMTNNLVEGEGTIHVQNKECSTAYNLRQGPKKKRKMSSFLYSDLRGRQISISRAFLTNETWRYPSCTGGTLQVEVNGDKNTELQNEKKCDEEIDGYRGESEKLINNLPEEILAMILMEVILEEGDGAYLKLSLTCKQWYKIVTSTSFMKQCHHAWLYSLQPRSFWEKERFKPFLVSFKPLHCISCGRIYKSEGPGYFGGRGKRGEFVGWHWDLEFPGFCSKSCHMYYEDNYVVNSD